MPGGFLLDIKGCKVLNGVSDEELRSCLTGTDPLMLVSQAQTEWLLRENRICCPHFVAGAQLP